MELKEKIIIKAESGNESKASEIAAEEIKLRIDAEIAVTGKTENANIIFIENSSFNKDEYELSIKNNQINIVAYGIRGFIFAIGMILRKSVVKDSIIIVPDSISGKYAPEMKIRGHQLGYRTTPNTYDAWDYEQYRRYYLDLMYFGMNTVEHIPYEKGVSKRNPLMKYDEEEFLAKTCETADELDLDISLWHPNVKGETDESAAERRKSLYSRLKRLNYVFIPGGDPGNLPADVFVSRVKAISKVMKEVHPEAQMWPSVQAPHEFENWGDVFTEEIQKCPDEIDGIIYGPNHAFSLEEIRKRIPEKYPLRFYPDITHNVRCEYPVHYDKLDWHFAYNNNLSRECTNPRPFEFAQLHKATREYFTGSVSYSEGITDDVNKCVWSALDFDFDANITEALKDYSRLYFPGFDENLISHLIIGLEKNWSEKPEYSQNVEETYTAFKAIYDSSKNLQNNWRFVQLYLRSVCDKYIKNKREEDLSAIETASTQRREEALKTLEAPYKQQTEVLEKEIEKLCEDLFRLIGYQSSTEKYYADDWERGAILDTYTLPVSDRRFLINIIKNGSEAQIKKAFYRKETDGFYYSVVYNGIDLKSQKDEIYVNFQGDRPNTNDGTLPEAQFSVYDNFSFVYSFKGLEKTDYALRVCWLNESNEEIDDLCVKLNGNTVYYGKQFGEIDEEYSLLNHKEFITAKYKVPKEYISEKENIIEFSEAKSGVMFAEFRLDKE